MRLTEMAAEAAAKVARRLEPPPEEAPFVAAALDRLGRLSPTDRTRALNSALLAAGGSDPDAKRNAVTLLQAARRLDDMQASLRQEIGTQARAVAVSARPGTAGAARARPIARRVARKRHGSRRPRLR